ncbi:MAG: glutamine-hydrolyzing GMP synthase [Bdellovibrionales bacterium RIFCSPHIGHO2_01_FULL_40_29]|nr:MAG: glutamine-hydrolyzing GMP synthase [Bdellovibrionales bacterium RIFCSPHIGHO2_01_FULL_40_29]OFZ32970.1 MAG: glutamine-hydrolyzing GMP synthase [Bdellovibrionales bacterium RIFCSPHIGHO2_02_FULL_40_15]
MVVKKNGFLILDFGSQVTMLIARRLRDLGYYSEIFPYHLGVDAIKEFNPDGIILSGGPNSVYDSLSPQRNVQELLECAPVLGICYGMQLLAQQLGGQVESGLTKEYGLTEVEWDAKAHQNLKLPWPAKHKIWMSHGDVVSKIPKESHVLLRSDSHIAGFYSDRYWALQYHPEVSHSEYGTEVLHQFAAWCGAEASWKNDEIVTAAKKHILDRVETNSHVLCALSGGVDSSVVATLLTKTLGAARVHCVFINNGLLRASEFETVLEAYKKIGLNVIGVDAEKQFLQELAGVSDPEKKRKIIGKLFIEVFEQTLNTELLPFRDEIKYLAQGTLYPDVIESISSIGGSVTIKSHHNVGGLPEKMKLSLVEPVRNLFKDEVRKLGTALGLEKTIIDRHPFPGPGLAIRIIGDITREKLDILKKADALFIQALRDENIYHKIWQAFCVLLPIQTVGVQGDARTYEFVLSLRAVTSVDGMTADWYNFEPQFLKMISNKITNQVRGINRIVYDITSKPPATIEWE